MRKFSFGQLGTEYYSINVIENGRIVDVWYGKLPSSIIDLWKI